MVPANVLDWAVKAVAPGGRIVDVVPLPGWSPAPPWLLHIDGNRSATYAVLRTEPVGQQRHVGYAREVQALALAEEHALAAPRVIAADVDGSEVGDPATLVTALPGCSSPTFRSPEELRGYGTAVASLRAVAAKPHGDLRRRHGPLDVEHAASERRRAMRYEKATGHRGLVQPTTGRSALLEQGEEQLGKLAEPPGPQVLVHADLHLGNTLWIGNHVTGMVDWDAAGVGPDGIDLGLARFDAVIQCPFDPSDSAAAVLEGWQSAAGVERDEAVVAYWDARAALNAPVRFGSPDGRGPERRDAFLRAALRTLA